MENTNNEWCSSCGLTRELHQAMPVDHPFSIRIGNDRPDLQNTRSFEEIAESVRARYGGLAKMPTPAMMLGGYVVPTYHSFADLSRLAVLETLGPENPLHYRGHLELSDLYVVWSVKVLKNWKTLVSTDKFDGVYFEVTYNGDTGEAYVDEYRKSRNTVVKIADGKPASV